MFLPESKLPPLDLKAASVPIFGSSCLPFLSYLMSIRQSSQTCNKSTAPWVSVNLVESSVTIGSGFSSFLVELFLEVVAFLAVSTLISSLPIKVISPVFHQQNSALQCPASYIQ